MDAAKGTCPDDVSNPIVAFRAPWMLFFCSIFNSKCFLQWSALNGDRLISRRVPLMASTSYYIH